MGTRLMGTHRLISVYLALVAVAAAVQFVLYPLYAYDSDGEFMSSALDAWYVVDWLMAVGLILMIVTTSREKCSHAGDTSADLRPWLRSNVMFYGTVLLALAFVPNWFTWAWSPNHANATVWHLIDTALPVMFAAEAHRLWRAASA